MQCRPENRGADLSSVDMSSSESSLSACQCQFSSVSNHDMVMAHYTPTAFAKEDICKLRERRFSQLCEDGFWLNEPALKVLACCGACKIFDIGPFGSQRCYQWTRILPKVPARWSKRCYFGEGNCHFRAQKGAISGQTFAGASRGPIPLR